MTALSTAAHNLGGDTREKLPICERLEAWAKVSFSQDRTRDLLKARDTIEALVEALEDIASVDLLFVDVSGTYCAFEKIIDRAQAALSRARNGGQP